MADHWARGRERQRRHLRVQRRGQRRLNPIPVSYHHTPKMPVLCHRAGEPPPPPEKISVHEYMKRKYYRDKQNQVVQWDGKGQVPHVPKEWRMEHGNALFFPGLPCAQARGPWGFRGAAGVGIRVKSLPYTYLIPHASIFDAPPKPQGVAAGTHASRFPWSSSWSNASTTTPSPRVASSPQVRRPRCSSRPDPDPDPDSDPDPDPKPAPEGQERARRVREKGRAPPQP